MNWFDEDNARWLHYGAWVAWIAAVVSLWTFIIDLIAGEGWGATEHVVEGLVMFYFGFIQWELAECLKPPPWDFNEVAYTEDPERPTLDLGERPKFFRVLEDDEDEDRE